MRGSGRGPVSSGRMIGAMAISRDEVLHVAKLARLELSEGELERFSEQLSAILEAVGKVSELDLSGVEPTAHPLDLSNVWAEDEPRPSMSVDEALANAPARDEGGFFRVPAA
jgi:aspartyl-tRNA(Asn)/glutamyl-tRNA(Gln) amidotransferase subunit C